MSFSSLNKKRCEDCGTERNEDELQFVPCCEYPVCCTKAVCNNDVNCMVYCKNEDCKKENLISRERYTKNLWWYEKDYNKYVEYGTNNIIDLEEAYNIMYPSPGTSFNTCKYCNERYILDEKWNFDEH